MPDYQLAIKQFRDGGKKRKKKKEYTFPDIHDLTTYRFLVNPCKPVIIMILIQLVDKLKIQSVQLVILSGQIVGEIFHSY